MDRFFWFTDHALARMKHEELTEDEVRAVLARPERLEPGNRPDCEVYFAWVNDRPINVVLESGYRVVTAYLNRHPDA